MFRNRSVVEILVLTLTFLVSSSIVGVGLLIFVLEMRDPSTDTTEIGNRLATFISAILGALLGLLAGKSEALNSLGDRPSQPQRRRKTQAPQ